MSSIHTNLKSVVPPPLASSVSAAFEQDRKNGSLGLECRVRALRMLAVTLLKQLESMGSLAAEQNDLQVDSLVDEFEAQLIQSALVLTNGHQRRAAKLLGLKANTLNNKMRRHELAAQL
jgi:DNA-binding NtrC family response regulator